MILLNGEEGGGSALKDLRMDSSGFLSFLYKRDKSSRMIDVSSKKCRQVHTQNSHTYEFFRSFFLIYVVLLAAHPYRMPLLFEKSLPAISFLLRLQYDAKGNEREEEPVQEALNLDGRMLKKEEKQEQTMCKGLARQSS